MLFALLLVLLLLLTLALLLTTLSGLFLPTLPLLLFSEADNELCENKCPPLPFIFYFVSFAPLVVLFPPWLIDNDDVLLLLLLVDDDDDPRK